MADPFTRSDAAHLLRRAAWGGTPEEIDQAVDDGLEATVGRLFDPAAAPIIGEPVRRPGFDAFDAEALQSWFVRLAATSPTPAIERLTWFWSGHFATGLDKIELPDLLHRQLVMLRRSGLGRFDDLLKGVVRDAAMNLWLDLHTSTIGNPNENFARELMELFSLGAGNGYTQRDVVEVARAFTGYGLRVLPGIERPIGTELRHGSHDHGVKRILGREGRFDGDDVVDLIVERRECHEFVARRLWHRYAGTRPNREVVARIADAFATDLRTVDALSAMFTLPDFYAADVREGLVCQPVEAIVRTVRGFELPLYDAERVSVEDAERAFEEASSWEVLPPWLVAEACEQMGQRVGFPPNVGGWPHNDAWLDSSRAAGRLVVGISLGELVAGLPNDLGESLRRASSRPARLTEALMTRFGVTDWSTTTESAVAASVAGLDPISSVASAFAVAFTSPEVTLA